MTFPNYSVVPSEIQRLHYHYVPLIPVSPLGLEADRDYSMSSVKDSVIDLPQLRMRTTYFQAVETDVLHYWRMILIAVHPLLLQACPATAAAVRAIIDFGTCYQHCFQAEAAVDHAAVAVEAVAVTAQSNFVAVVIAAFEDLEVERQHRHHYQAAVVADDCAPNFESAAAAAVAPGLRLAADGVSSSHSRNSASWEQLPPHLPPAAHGAGFQYLTLVRRSNRAAPEPAAADDDDGTGH